MARSDRRHPRRAGRLVLVLVLALLVGIAVVGAVSWRAGRLQPLLAPYVERLQADEPRRPGGPAQVAPPAGLDLPAPVPPTPVAAPLDGSASTPRAGAVRRVLAPALRDDDLGRRVRGVVIDAVSGAEVFRVGRGPAIAASTTKLVTAAAALLALGPEATFTTSVVAGGPGTVVLRGGGDPFLERAPADPADPVGPAYPPRADVTTLARQTAAVLLAEGATSTQVGYDASLFTGPAVNPAWQADYVTDGVVSPVSALWVDGGRAPDGFARVADPALAAARDFADALTAAGVAVSGPPVAGVAAPGGRLLGSVRSAPVREIVQRMLESSDNETAEVLAHQVALARGLPGTFTDAAAAVLATLAERGVPTAGIAVYDGSGLSRSNRIEPAALTGVLRAAADPAYPELAALLPGLPVAGFTGSLSNRFAAGAPEGRGVVRAKTGTLEGVTALAGTVVDATGHPYFFALLADRVDEPDATASRDRVDAALAGLAACSCSR